MPIAHRTEKQLEASRLNGGKSTGPKTPEGKQRAIRRPRKFQDFSLNSAVLAGENDAVFKQHLADFVLRFQPTDNVEFRLVRRLAAIDWRLSRVAAIETCAIDLATKHQTTPLLESSPWEYRNAVTSGLSESVKTRDLPHYILKREVALERSYDATLKQLIKLRERFANPADCPQMTEMRKLIDETEEKNEIDLNPEFIENTEEGLQFEPDLNPS